MKRKALGGVLALMLFVTAAHSATILVPKDQEFIQDAVDAAQPGDTIVISKGIWNENVRVNGKDNLTFLGKRAVITGRNSGPIFVVENASGVTISKITFRNNDDIGLHLIGCSDVEVTACKFDGIAGDGLRADDCAQITVRSCKFSNIGDYGIAFSAGLSPVETSDSTIDGCKFKVLSETAVVINGDDNVVRNCKVKGTDEDGYELATNGESSGNTFENCKATLCEDDGFEIGSGSTGNTFRNCSVKLCDDDGFDIEGDSNTLDSCKVSRSGDNGFDVDGDDNTFRSCKASKVEDDGFDVDGEGNLFEDCKTSNSGEDGFDIDGINNIYRRNVSKKAGDNGFQVSSGVTGSTFTENKAKKSSGFDLSDATQSGANTFEDNKFKTISPPGS